MRKSVVNFSRRLALMMTIILAVLLLTGQQNVSNKVKPKVVQNLLERKLKTSFVPGEIIVKRKVAPGITAEMAPAQLTELGLQPKGGRTAGGEQVYRLLPQGPGVLAENISDRTMAATRALRSRPDVEYAQPNYILHIVSTPNDPQFAHQWHYLNRGTGSGNSPGGIGLPGAWDTTKGSSSVVVAVVDTGILPNHEDIVGSPNLIAGFDMITDPDISKDGDGRDADPTDPGDAAAAGDCGAGTPALPSSWHGTHVAGTIGVGRTNNGLGVAGINWNVKVQPVRVLGKCGGTTVDINDGIRWAAGLHVPGVPDNTTPAKVINMSLGGANPCTDSPSTQSAINDAVAAGVTVVVAAGNDAEDASGFFPASCNNVISVAASDARGYLVQRYSNFGATVKIMAPGGDVQRHDSGNESDGVLSMVQGGYAYYNGTSMAAPHVAGVVALMLAQTPGLTPAEILTRLTGSAIPRSSVECPKSCGAGLLNASGVLVPSGLFLALEPIDSKLKVAGPKTVQLTATFRQGGVPQAGQTVTFTSGNSAIAEVTPASAVTDANGQATVTANALKEGDTVVHAQAAGQDAQAQIHVVKAPALSNWGLVLAGLLLFLVFYRYAAKFMKADLRRR